MSIPEPDDFYPDLPLDDPWYAPTAYNSRRIPDQAPQAEDHNLSALERKVTMRLPWGGTEEVAPSTVFTLHTPEILRRTERMGEPLDREKFQVRFDHECYRHAPAAFRTQVIFFLEFAGKALSVVIPPLALFTYLILIINHPPMGSPSQQAIDSLPIILSFIGVPLTAWGLSYSLQRWLPGIAFKPGRGPLWELNRRTGMVTVFDYSQGRRNPKAISHPFYEFDAYVGSTVDRQGLPMHMLYFYHRYSRLYAHLAALIGADRHSETCFAFWDTLQNYMDISRPLPDIPLWEKYRHLDPVTAEYDRRTGRNPRYWRDMDDETWKEKQAEMERKVRRIDTASRPDRMAEHVDYQVG